MIYFKYFEKSITSISAKFTTMNVNNVKVLKIDDGNSNNHRSYYNLEIVSVNNDNTTKMAYPKDWIKAVQKGDTLILSLPKDEKKLEELHSNFPKLVFSIGQSTKSFDLISSRCISDITFKGLKLNQCSIKGSGNSYSNITIQTWHCFGACSEGGNVIKFVMKHESLSFPEAVKWLAAKYGIAVEEEQPTEEQRLKAQKRESLFIVNQRVAEYYADNILSSAGDTARKYAESRWGKDLVRDMGIGFALDEWQGLINFAQSAGLSTDLLLELSIIKKSDKGKLYDVYRNRVMIPIRDRFHRVIGFTARDISNVEGTAKYMGYPAIPHKDNGENNQSENLFNKIINKIDSLVHKKEEQTTDQNNCSKTMNKNYVKVNTILNVEGVEVDKEGKVMLTEAQIKALNDRIDALEADAKTKDDDIAAKQTEIDNLKKGPGADTHTVEGNEGADDKDGDEGGKAEKIDAKSMYNQVKNFI